ncbi:MAG: hydroxyisourate hydrolase [Nitrospira sp.]|nr:hydroxyisourate hydrolase [Nitrospira sp.]
MAQGVRQTGRHQRDSRSREDVEDCRTGTDLRDGLTGSLKGEVHVASFFPEVVVVFTVQDLTQTYHVPLLLSPFGYSTYRRS